MLALLVVVRHSIQHYFPSGTDCIVYHMISGGISTVAVPTFFLITGYLMCDSGFEKIKRQVKRIGKLYLIWTLIYLPLTVFQWRGNQLDFVDNLIVYLQNLIFSGSYYHLWYLPAAMVALLLSFMLKEKKYGMSISAFLLFIGVITGPYVDFVNRYEISSTVLSIYKQVFITTRNGVFIGTPFIFMGILIGRNEESIRKISKWKINSVVITDILFLIIEALSLYNIHGDVTNNILISDVLIAPCLLIIAIRCSMGNTQSLILRKSSTAIYCVHALCLIIVSVASRKIGFDESALVYIALCLIVSVAVGVALAISSNRIKLLKHLM